MVLNHLDVAHDSLFTPCLRLSLDLFNPDLGVFIKNLALLLLHVFVFGIKNICIFSRIIPNDSLYSSANPFSYSKINFEKKENPFERKYIHLKRNAKISREIE